MWYQSGTMSWFQSRTEASLSLGLRLLCVWSQSGTMLWFQSRTEASLSLGPRLLQLLLSVTFAPMVLWFREKG